jgi:hypothetical protein
MTELEWLNCAEPAELFAFLYGKVCDRPRRLFACACCRRIWHLHILHGRKGVEVAERYADGMAGAAEMRGSVMDYGVAHSVGPAAEQATRAAGCCVWQIADAEGASRYALNAVQLSAGLSARDDEAIDQCVLLRDVVGNPFREVELDPSWCKWSNGTVRRMAQAIYADRRFDDLPILADALEDAGCTNEDILTHCRERNEHVRGCWVVDLLLGKM